MTFTAAEQITHRKEFIAECRQKAWGARCHADWIAKNIDELMAEYKKIQDEDRTLEADIKELASAIDSHTVDNRNKRKALQEKRNALGPQAQFLAQSAQQAQKAMQGLLQSVESTLALAAHAETWVWKETAST